LRDLGIDYRGVLYAGCMLTDDGPKLIEFNVRFGDPEAEVVLARVIGDLFSLLVEVASGNLRSEVRVADDAAVCVIAAAPGYPHAPVPGAEIRGVETADMVPGVTVLHAGTARDDRGVLRVAGGRVLGVRATAPTLTEARRRVYQGLDAISFDGMQLRSDIALSAATGSVRGRTGR
jgi:phosphoribosylamine--glycine ligase